MVNGRVTYIGKEKRWWDIRSRGENRPYPLPYNM
jgi:hypothetical protein